MDPASSSVVAELWRPPPQHHHGHLASGGTHHEAASVVTAADRGNGSRSGGGGGSSRRRPRRDVPEEEPSSKLASTSGATAADSARREKISERMKVLQDLVPGCNKVIGKASVLDEIINYIQSLQRQVEFLSVKLEAVNAHMNNANVSFPSKDVSLFMNKNLSFQDP
nr:unnamed protein product [Digitaria exilis]